MSEPRAPIRPAESAEPQAAAAPHGLGRLLEGVAAEAHEESEAMLEAARRRAERELAEAEQRSREIESEAEMAGRAEGEREARRRLALAEIEARQETMALREDRIQRAVELATQKLNERLCGPDGDGLLRWLVATGAQMLGESEVRVRARAADRERIEQGAHGRGPTLRFEETELEEPGVVLTSLDGSRFVDLRASEILRRRLDAARQAALRALFEQDSSP